MISAEWVRQAVWLHKEAKALHAPLYGQQSMVSKSQALAIESDLCKRLFLAKPGESDVIFSPQLLPATITMLKQAGVIIDKLSAVDDDVRLEEHPIAAALSPNRSIWRLSLPKLEAAAAAEVIVSTRQKRGYYDSSEDEEEEHGASFVSEATAASAPTSAHEQQLPSFYYQTV